MDYTYVAVDPRGHEARGLLEATDQSEALRRIKEMGLFPTKVAAKSGQSAVRSGDSTVPAASTGGSKTRTRSPAIPRHGLLRYSIAFGPFSPFRALPSAHLAVFTRQLATLVEAGLPLLRGLRLLQEQEESRRLKRIIGELSMAIESGSSLAEALAAYPKVFNGLYVSMVRAGEISGALESTLKRLAEFMEKAQKIRGKVKSALFYPCAVLCVAAGVVSLLLIYVLPRFKTVFVDLGNGQPLPSFTRFVFGISDAVAHHALWAAGLLGVAAVGMGLLLRTSAGRLCFDRCKLAAPVVGSLFRKLAISRLSRTLGTLMANGVPILQALTIVKDTARNVVVSNLVSLVHENVKQGEPIAPTLKASSIFPAMVAGMVDVGEQTGALPDMLMKVADIYDEEVDNATAALTSLLEPIMIVFLAVVVGSIVIAMFLPLIALYTGGGIQNGGQQAAGDL
jgi:type IV pilus assembly protein PilC